MYPTLSPADIADLAKFLADPGRPEDTLCFQELQGFLYSIACSPEIVPPSAWLPIISDEQDIGFEDEAKAHRIMALIMGLYNDINTSVLERSDSMPFECEFRPDIEENFDSEAAVSQWCHGFMLGHDWLEEVWDEYLPEQLDGELGSCAMVLSFFSSRRMAEAFYAESTTTPSQRKPKIPFIEFADNVRGLFPDALSSYAHIGRGISEVVAGMDDSNA